MAEAITLAAQAKQQGDLPFGAVIVRAGVVISRGMSLERASRNVTRHAELSAISDACTTLQRASLADCVLYSTCKPCTICTSAALQAGIGRLVIGTTRDDLPQFFTPR
jgi:tRNA(Arg) A34 adenosine deaminase TadA